MSCSGSWQQDVFRLPLRLATGGSWLSCSFCSLACLKKKSQQITFSRSDRKNVDSTTLEAQS